MKGLAGGLQVRKVQFCCARSSSVRGRITALGSELAQRGVWEIAEGGINVEQG